MAGVGVSMAQVAVVLLLELVVGRWDLVPLHCLVASVTDVEVGLVERKLGSH